MATELWLVRHGQAAFGTDDYDRLTDLGWQQARWLGAHLKSQGLGFARIGAGTLRRQQETAGAIADILGGSVATVAGLEEYDADALLRAAGVRPGTPLSRREHFQTLRTAMTGWAAGTLTGLPESWADFQDRTMGAARALSSGASPVLASSSGGAIAMIVAQVLDLSPGKMIELNLQARNTGITRLIFTGRTTYLTMFNAVPHLEHPDRNHAVTFS